MITGINTVTIYVHNQNEALRWYKEVLGFQVRRWEPLGPAGSWIEMGPAGKSTALVLYPQAMMPDWESRRAFIIFGCEDISETFETLSSRGVTFTQEPADLGWGLFAMFTDPFGNELGLMQVTKAVAPMPGGGMPRPPGGGPPPPPPPARR